MSVIPVEGARATEPVESAMSPGHAPAGQDGLGLERVGKRFDSVQALVDCSFSVPRGRMLGFLGPNGAGKTTAMRAVFGLVRIDSGSVLWDGCPVGPSRRLRFGYMPEERGLYPRMPLGPAAGREALEDEDVADALLVLGDVRATSWPAR